MDDDELPLDEVGPWAKEKHERLRKYVDISRAVRRKFLASNGATYIDLYCGWGRATIRNTREVIDDSPLVAFKSAKRGGAPFSQIHIADVSPEKCRAAASRLAALGASPRVEVGEAQATALRIAKALNPYDLHFVFLDPYNLESLPFSIVETFCRFKHMDMLIHISAQDLQRNLDAYSATVDGPLDKFVPGWRDQIDLKQSQRAIRAGVIAFWSSKVEALGLPRAEHAELITGPVKNQRLYWLIFISRHPLAKEFWNKVRSTSGQSDLFGRE